MPSQLPNGNFQFRAERFWYFPKDEINQLNQYKANFRAPKIELQKGLLVYGKSGRLDVNNLFILFDKFDIEAENIFTKHEATQRVSKNILFGKHGSALR